MNRARVVGPLTAAVLLLVSLASVGGCSAGSRQDPASPTPQNAGPSTLTDSEVLDIARQAVSQNDTWVEQAEFEAPKRTDEGWSVLVWRLPKTPGGHRLVQIDATGQVTGYVRGR